MRSVLGRALGTLSGVTEALIRMGIAIRRSLGADEAPLGELSTSFVNEYSLALSLLSIIVIWKSVAQISHHTPHTQSV